MPKATARGSGKPKKKRRWFNLLLWGVVAVVIGVPAYFVYQIGSYIAESTGTPEGYPAYYRYSVELKVDNRPLTLSRVIKCTGEIFRKIGSPPNSRSFRNPSIIGAYISENEAVYVGALGICNWAARRDDKRFKIDEYLPAFAPVIFHVPDTMSFFGIEAYVSRRLLTSDDSFIQFIAVKAEHANEADFLTSEEQAKDGPDLRTFAASVYVCEPPVGAKGRSAGYFGALVFPEETWRSYPDIADWVATLSDDVGAYDLLGVPDDPSPQRAREAFLTNVYERTHFYDQFSLPQVGGTLPKSDPPAGTKEWWYSLDQIHPAFIKDGMIEIDLTKTGRVGLYDKFLHPDIWKQEVALRRARETGKYQSASVTASKIRIAASEGIYFVKSANAFVVIHSNAFIYNNDRSEPVEGLKDDSYCQ